MAQRAAANDHLGDGQVLSSDLSLPLAATYQLARPPLMAARSGQLHTVRQLHPHLALPRSFQRHHRIVHNALAVVSYDSAAKRWRFLAWRATGETVDAEATVGDKSLIWSFRDPRVGQIRFTIKMDQQGRWFEIGETSMDGKGWHKFFEMTLQRVR